jgi:putative nucleotidyltransferase with HDIG domain
MVLSRPSEDPLTPAMVDLFEEAQERVARRLSRRERSVEGMAAVTFLAVAGPMAVLMAPGRGFSVPIAAVLVAAYALAARVKFPVGAGFTVPTQPLFVVMLFALPPCSVPMLVAAGFLLAEIPDLVREKTHPERAVLPLGDAWHAIGPALVLGLAGAPDATWEVVPLLLLALAAQFAFDLATVTIREWLALGIAPATQLAERGWLYLVDALLTPLGLMAAFSQEYEPYSALLTLPLVGLLSIFARERTERLQHTAELSQTYRGTAHLLGDVVEADDAYTGSHSRSVVSLSLSVARRMGLDAAALRRVEFAALLHDVGKIAIPKEVINKPGPLDEGEWELIRTHTVEGERMLERVGGLLKEVGQIVRSCHERWDGRGYPDGLAGDEIPIEARIVCASDAFNAMTTTRSYRKGMTVDFALAELRACAGSQFDPQVAECLASVVREQLPVDRARSTEESSPPLARAS